MTLIIFSNAREPSESVCNCAPGRLAQPVLPRLSLVSRLSHNFSFCSNLHKHSQLSNNHNHAQQRQAHRQQEGRRQACQHGQIQVTGQEQQGTCCRRRSQGQEEGREIDGSLPVTRRHDTILVQEHSQRRDGGDSRTCSVTCKL